jgi:hypothetical protein
MVHIVGNVQKRVITEDHRIGKDIEERKMNETKVFIHVGLHKTGTTFLQNEVFPKIPNINYQRHVDLTTKVEQGELNLFSDENLDGGSYRLFSNPKDRYTIAYNLRQMFPTAKIIISIRNTDSWLISAYKQYTLAYWGYTFQQYFSKFNKDGLDFTSYINYLRKLFGEKNVSVMKYEDLIADPTAFVDCICSFMGVETPVFESKKVYESLTDMQINLIILFDKIFKSKILHFMLSMGIKAVRKDETIEKWRNRKY